MFQLLSFSNSSIIHVHHCCHFETRANVKPSDWIIAAEKQLQLFLASMEVSTTSSPTGDFAHIPQLTQFSAQLLFQISLQSMCATHHTCM